MIRQALFPTNTPFLKQISYKIHIFLIEKTNMIKKYFQDYLKLLGHRREEIDSYNVRNTLDIWMMEQAYEGEMVLGVA